MRDLRCRRTVPALELARTLAPAVLDPMWKEGRLTRGSTFLAWIRHDERAGWFYHRLDPSSRDTTSRGGVHAGPVLADAATAVLIHAYSLYGDENDRTARARAQVRRMIDAGCADPALVEMAAWLDALGGRPVDLEAAIAASNRALALAPAHGDSAWASLEIARDNLAGRLERMLDRQEIAPDGSVRPIRRHHPGARARRVRPLRFVIA